MLVHVVLSLPRPLTCWLDMLTWYHVLISCRLNLLLIASTRCRAISSAWNHLHKIIPEQDLCSSDAGSYEDPCLQNIQKVQRRTATWFSTWPFSSLSSNTAQNLCSAARHPFPRGPQPDSVGRRTSIFSESLMTLWIMMLRVSSYILLATDFGM